MDHLRDDRFAGAITALITPFTPDGRSIDLDRLDEQVERQASGGVAGVVVAGTTGEAPTLTEAEYRALVERTVQTAKAHDMVVIAGTGSNSTAHAVELQRLALHLGADAGLSVTPYYNKPTQEGLHHHFATIADAVELPLILYNIPGRTAATLGPETIERLYANPWVVGVKEATGSPASATAILRRCPGIALLAGDDACALPFMALGGVGVVSVVSNIAPDRVATLCRAMLEGDLHAARSANNDLAQLASDLFLETNPICVKAAMRMLDMDSGTLRAPLTPAQDATRAALRDSLDRLHAQPAAC